ncbi:MAG TPA: hypothetical protein VNT30_09985 [Stellaceae bacterium]|nr:hypothetical protein [Stellaceae bacterium]
MKSQIGLMLLAVAAQALCGGVVMAGEFRNHEPWGFKVRGSAAATARASTMWQVEQMSQSNTPATTSSATSGTASGGVAGAGTGANVSSIANMNVITIVVGDGGTADVAIETEQANRGKVDGTAVAATGDAVDIGTIK